MRKIGILTYFTRDNYGLYAQARATYEMLKACFPGDRVEFVNLLHRPKERRRPKGLRLLLGGDVSGFLKLRRRRRLHRAALAALPKSSPQLHTFRRDEAVDYVKRQGYDLLVCGADVILKYINSPDKVDGGKPPIYWLPKDIGCPHVMLASAADVTQVHMLTGWQREMLAESADGFDLLAVRDEMTYKLLADLGLAGDPRLKRVPDPTFAYEVDGSPADRLWKKLRLPTGRKIVGVRAHDTPLVREVIAKLRRTCFVISIVADVACADYSMHQLGMMEWMGMFRHFDVHLTISFHDSIFAVKNGTPPVLLDESSRVDPKTGDSKNQVLYRDLDLSDSYFNPVLTRLTADEIVGRIEQLLPDPAPAVARARARMAEQKRLYLDALHSLKNLRIASGSVSAARMDEVNV